MLLAMGGIALLGLANMDDSRLKISATYQAIESAYWVAFVLLFATGISAIRNQFLKQAGWLGKFSTLAGIVAALIGFIALLAFLLLEMNVSFWHAKIFTFFSAAIALMLFGIDALRGQYFPRWGYVPFIAGLVPVSGILGQIALQELPWGSTLFDPVVDYGPLVFMIGIYLVGYVVKEGSIAG